MAILKRPMFRKGGSANEGIMHGLDRSGYAGGGTIGGGTIQGTDLGYRTGYANPASLVTSTGQPLTYKPSVTTTPTTTTGTWQGPIESPQMRAIRERLSKLKKFSRPFEKVGRLSSMLQTFAGSSPALATAGLTSLAFAPTAGIAYMNRPKTKEALEYMKSMNQSGVFDETAMEGEYDDYVEEFTKLNDIEKYTPIKMSDFFKDTKELKEEITETEDLKKKIFEKTKKTGVPGGRDKGMTYKKPGPGGIPDITIQDAKETLKEKNKRYMEMMAPHMQKRMVADAFGAASEAFGESTGNTRQDIANAISAAAGRMGTSKDIYDKVSMLTLQGEIMKDVEASKTKKLTKGEEYEEIRTKYPDVYKDLMKKESAEDKFLKIVDAYGGGAEGRKMAVKNQWKDDKDFFGVLKSDAKQQKKQIKAMPDSAIGKVVYDAIDDSYYKIIVNEDGDKDKEFLGQRKG